MPVAHVRAELAQRPGEQSHQLVPGVLAAERGRRRGGIDPRERLGIPGPARLQARLDGAEAGEPRRLAQRREPARAEVDGVELQPEGGALLVRCARGEVGRRRRLRRQRPRIRRNGRVHDPDLARRAGHARTGGADLVRERHGRHPGMGRSAAWPSFPTASARSWGAPTSPTSPRCSRAGRRTACRSGSRSRATASPSSPSRDRARRATSPPIRAWRSRSSTTRSRTGWPRSAAAWSRPSAGTRRSRSWTGCRCATRASRSRCAPASRCSSSRRRCSS